MAKISYVNGRYTHHRDAMVHMEDRGYQFSDGIYEVMAFYNKRLLDEKLHMDRLKRSLIELLIPEPMTEKAMRLVIQELIARNNRTDGTVYIQITRGVAKRDHAFPNILKPSVVMAITGPKIPKEKEIKEGVSVITLPDLRWARRDVKSISLLANILAKNSANERGAREAWLVDDDNIVTEGSVSNNAIVNAKGEIITHPLSYTILGGITRDIMIRLAKKAGIKVIERCFSLTEAIMAKEAFLTGTTSNVIPVVRIDDKTVGTGKPGPVTMKLIKLHHDHITRETGKIWN